MNEELGVAWISGETGERMTGFFINSAYCAVTGRWLMLVAGDDARFHTVHAEGLEVTPMWAVEMTGPEDDSADDYEE